MKTCTKCNVYKSLDNFYKDKRNKDGYRNDCSECCKNRMKKHYNVNSKQKLVYQSVYYRANSQYAIQYAKEWRKNNPEKTKQYHKEYSEKNKEKEKIRFREKESKRRALKKNNGVFYISKKELNSMLSSACVICSSIENITIDHIIPISRGGTHGIGNIQPMCLPCNTKKIDKTMSEFKYYMYGRIS